MSQFVGIPHGVNRLEEAVFNFERSGLHQPGRSTHDQPWETVDRLEANRHLVSPALADDTGQERRGSVDLLPRLLAAKLVRRVEVGEEDPDAFPLELEGLALSVPGGRYVRAAVSDKALTSP